MTSIIITAIVAFTLIILMLVVILLFAQSKLVQSGDVKITINGEKEIVTAAGSTLLNTLSAQKIFLPSACGGGGTCAMCKCQVLDGGGDVLPTEEGHLSRTEQKEKVRLSCQVKVKNDMDIQIPEEVFGIKKWECEVVSNYNVSTFIKEFVVKLPEGETMDFEAGGYIQIDVPEITVNFKDMDITPKPELNHPSDVYQSDWDNFGMWDLVMKNDEPIYRAYSMANHPAEGSIVMLTIRIATPPWDRTSNRFMDVNPGICSSYVFSRKPGDKVMVSGPYGEFSINPTEREMVYIGGGAGMAPLRAQIFHLFHTEKTGRRVQYWYGGRSKKELFYVDHFRKIEDEFPNFQFNIALSEPLPEDNWKIKKQLSDKDGDGYTGFIHQALYDNYLKDHEELDEVEFYLCGPPMMNAAVLKMLDDLGVPPENIRFDDFGG
ncbi:NADH:ubiquinone reductase (Na(+)-transporting) subunit F [Aureibacter tunicatorum]|uniref:Na(+)-translocating NADH-quinone reductase subunit F n=1 Tax=Aureibacter tunicatorum TaxID=866807 RepID=A0AAE3XIK4_9BACT|nr:NADH:ubiquinone reductase (Na(+)-transporting) subunit F [Aureibacter tunicatorum]MDR6237082.1 Na+-transporting NADH:ubiquinone oxidoreductase subunit F [Aureibacter tunicatorum]BDD06074.1 Na(+)-translocating NADH-quinone reductase subunit F [Aureibacter tunicatorum]